MIVGTTLTLLAGCGAKPDRLQDPAYNIVLIVVDTLGAQNVAAYNPALNHTPHIDAFASNNARFSRAYATAPWTQPSVASIITSLSPSGHGVHNIRDVLDPAQQTLAEELQDRGYATHGVISHHLIGSQLGYAQGFDHYDESAVGGHTGLSSEKITDASIVSIDQALNHGGDPSARKPFFLFAHYFDPHYYYHPHAAYDRSSTYTGPLQDVDDVWTVREMRPQLAPDDIQFLRDRHLEEIAFVDHHVGRLLRHLSGSGLDESTIVVVVSDHGEEFMGHGWFGHTRTLYDELIHVPLVMRIPGKTSPSVVDAPVSTLDIMPTLLAALPQSRRREGAQDGLSLLPYLSGEATWPEVRSVFSEVSFLPPSTRQQEKMAFKTSMVRGDLKLIHDRKAKAWELYRLSSDPEEQTDIAALEPLVTERMVRELTVWEEARDLPTEFTLAPPEGISEAELERLRGLGYIR